MCLKIRKFQQKNYTITSRKTYIQNSTFDFSPRQHPKFEIELERLCNTTINSNQFSLAKAHTCSYRAPLLLHSRGQYCALAHLSLQGPFHSLSPQGFLMRIMESFSDLK